MISQHGIPQGLRLLVVFLAIPGFGPQSRLLFAAKSSPAPIVRQRRDIIREFYRLRERILDERGTEKDVVALLALLADDAIVEHPRADAKMDKAQVRRGNMAHLNEGKHAHITIHTVRAGRDFMVVELTLEYDVPAQNGALEHIRRRVMTIFEFAGIRIRRVAEY